MEVCGEEEFRRELSGRRVTEQVSRSWSEGELIAPPEGIGWTPADEPEIEPLPATDENPEGCRVV